MSEIYITRPKQQQHQQQQIDHASLFNNTQLPNQHFIQRS